MAAGIGGELLLTISWSYPWRKEALVAPFKVAEDSWGWSWELRLNEDTLGVEQQRLLYAFSSSPIGGASRWAILVFLNPLR